MFLQSQYDVLMQSIRHLNIRLDIMNENDAVIDSLQGITTGGSLNLDANSTYRRTGSIEIIIDNNNVIPNPSSKIWFNKRLRIWVGLSNYNGEIVWFDYGKYAFSELSLNYEVTERLLSVTLLDYMAFLDGTLGGELSNDIKYLPENITMTDAFSQTLAELGRISLDKIIVNGYEATLPYTVEKNAGSTVYDLMRDLIGLFKGYEFFYDTDGYFRVQKIKDGKNDPVLWDFSQNRMNLTISYTSKMNFSNIKNSINVWGRKLDDGTQAKWTYKNKYSRKTVSDMDSITDMEIGDICYIVNDDQSYGYLDSKWTLLNFNVISIFNIESIGEKVHVYNDDNAFTKDQAQINAEYELWSHSNFLEAIDFTCVPIYMLDVNNKIRLKVPELDIDGDYLIQTINVPLNINDTMRITASKIYY